MIDINKGRYWDFGWQLISSCSRCSPGCDNCWSLAKEKRFHEGVEGKIEVHPERLSRPLKRKKPAVYAIWNDLFHKDVPTTFIDDVFERIAACPQHSFLILTKRAHLMEEKIYGNDTIEYFVRVLGGGDYLPNAWWGLTVCNQQEWDDKGRMFMSIPGNKFLSLEPLLVLEDIKLKGSGCQWCFGSGVNPASGYPCPQCFDIQGVILGGETGPKARPLQPDWVRSVRDQCQAAGVPFFFKSWGKYAPRIVNPPMMGEAGLEFPDKEIMTRVVKKAAGRILDGREWNQLPWINKEVCE